MLTYNKYFFFLYFLSMVLFFKGNCVVMLILYLRFTKHISRKIRCYKICEKGTLLYWILLFALVSLTNCWLYLNNDSHFFIMLLFMRYKLLEIRCLMPCCKNVVSKCIWDYPYFYISLYCSFTVYIEWSLTIEQKSKGHFLFPLYISIKTLIHK